MNLPAKVVDFGPKDRVDHMGKRHLPGLNAHQRHRSKQGHDPLRKIENPRGLEDQNKAKGHEGIHDTRHQPVQGHLHGIDQLFWHHSHSLSDSSRDAGTCPTFIAINGTAPNSRTENAPSPTGQTPRVCGVKLLAPDAANHPWPRCGTALTQYRRNTDAIQTRILAPSSVMRDAQIGINHRLIAAHFIGRAITDLLAIIHDNHPVAQVHNHAHIVFNQRNGRPKFVIHIQDKAAHVLFFLNVHPRHRLVQQKQRRLSHQRAGQLNPLFQPIRQARHRRLANGLNFQEINNLFSDFPVRRLFSLGLAPPQGLRKNPAFHMGQPTRHDVVQHRHPLKQGNVLEGARNPLAGDLKGLHRRTRRTFVKNLPLLRHIEPRNNVQH
mmetsp:Transcript_23536/g.41576  ORF Transcript_23536/g.41576 Transcript_23536/m.41576 type:complete len:380 (-) Transcript_23536:215-1354(-)